MRSEIIFVLCKNWLPIYNCMLLLFRFGRKSYSTCYLFEDELFKEENGSGGSYEGVDVIRR